MGLQIAIGDVRSVSPGLWIAPLAPADVRRLGEGQLAVGGRSIVGVWEPVYEAATRRLMIEPARATVFNVGDGDDVLVVDLGKQQEQASASSEPQIQTRVPAGLNNGDILFLAACRRERLPNHLVDAAKRILTTVRSKYPGQMKEGLARKWVNYPDNFLALVIQPRDESFAVHVWGKPNRFSAATLDIKPDRSRYSRFKLAKEAQLADAVRVIMESARLSTGR